MKLIEILTEARTDFIAAKSKDNLEQRAEQDTGKPISVDQIIATLASFDPSKNQQYLQWLVNNYLKSQFKLEDRFFVNQTLTRFEQVKRRLDKKDINQYSYKSLGDAIDPLFDQVELSDSDELGSDVKVLYNGPLGLLAIPLTEEASCRLGSGTKWCTAARENNMFGEYNETGPLYIWKDKSGKKYQFHFQQLQFMDARDESLSPQQLKQLRSNPVVDKLFDSQQQLILQKENMGVLILWAKEVIGGRWPEAEPIILSGTISECSHYACTVLHSRWPEFEQNISKLTAAVIDDAEDAEMLMAYVLLAVGTRLEVVEPIIKASVSKDKDFDIEFGDTKDAGGWADDWNSYKSSFDRQGRVTELGKKYGKSILAHWGFGWL